MLNCFITVKFLKLLTYDTYLVWTVSSSPELFDSACIQTQTPKNISSFGSKYHYGVKNYAMYITLLFL